MKSKLWGVIALIVAVFWLFKNPTGAAGTVREVIDAAGLFLNALIK